MFKIFVSCIIFQTLVSNVIGNQFLLSTSVLYGLSFVSHHLNNSIECINDLEILGDAVDNKQEWAIKAVDASGRPPAGFLWGDNFWLGSHLFCKEIMNKHPLEVNHNRMHADKNFDKTFPPYQLKFVVAHVYHNGSIQQKFQLPLDNLIRLGICLPNSCTKENTKLLLESYFKKDYLKIVSLYNLKMDVRRVRLVREDVSWLFKMPQTIILLIVIIFILVMSAIGTWMDIKSTKQYNCTIKSDIQALKNKVNVNKSPTTTNQNHASTNEQIKVPSTFFMLITFFSLHKNYQILTSKKVDTSDRFSLTSIHGIRFCSMFWILASHTIYYQADLIRSPGDVYRLGENLLAQPLRNSTYSVDTFLFISGLLLSYLFYKSRKPLFANNSKTRDVNACRKISEFVVMFTSRFLRLTPTYLISILSSIVLFKYLQETSPLYLSEEPHVRCTKYWWRNLLYINNLYPRSEMCLSWSWYLSLDMQLFLITSFLLILSTVAINFTVFLVVLIITSSITATIWKCLKIEYIITLDDQYTQLDSIYDLPWNRIGPYFIGAITGYILAIRKDSICQLSKTTIKCSWFVFTIINVWILYAWYFHPAEILFSAVYIGLSRTFWGVGLAWLVIACCTNNAGVINTLFSSNIWQPLSRLTYSTYLFHPILAGGLPLAAESPVIATGSLFTITGFSLLSTSYILAFVVSIIFESPCIHLTKRFLMCFKPKDPKCVNNSPTNLKQGVII